MGFEDLCSVEHELNALQLKQQLLHDSCARHLDELIEQMQRARNAWDTGGMSQDDSGAAPGTGHDADETGVASMMDVDSQAPARDSAGFKSTSEEAMSIVPSTTGKRNVVEQVQKKLVVEQREVYNGINKIIKLVDKLVVLDIEKAYQSSAVLDPQKIHVAIATHLFREGMFQLADNYVREAGAPIEANTSSAYHEMYSILEELRKHNVQRAIAWVTAHREQLEAIESTLEFRLHSVEFIRLLLQRDRAGAVKYAREHFGRFAKSSLPDIQRHMGFLLYATRLETSPYAPLVSETMWSQVIETFSRDSCRILGMAQDSALHVVVSAGTLAIPVLSKASRIRTPMNESSEWTGADHLPVEIPLPQEFRFHSIFACPVSREESTPDNPPMILFCGHALCKNSIGRLPRGNSRFKCPYCPSEQSPSKCTQINF